MSREITCDILFRPPTDELTFLPEGPYPAGADTLSWVAIQHGPTATTGSLNRLDLNSRENTEFKLPGRPGFAFPTTQDGIYAIGLERQLVLYDTARQAVVTTLADDIESAVEGTIINDGLAFEHGLIFGAKDLEFKEAKAGLYFWRARDTRLIRLSVGQTCSNGKAVRTVDGELRLLDIDTPTKVVREYRLDIESGTLGEPETVLDLTSQNRFPDGMILGPDGQSVIIAFYNPNPEPHGEAVQFDLESGQPVLVWKTPDSPQVTCPQLIKHDGRIRLVLTTAVEHMSPERRAQHPNAGCLFVAETPFDSLPDTPPCPC